jgi:hypothetical protein
MVQFFSFLFMRQVTGSSQKRLSQARVDLAQTWVAAVNKRPLSVMIVAWVYIVVGIMGFVFHLRETLANHDYRNGTVIELTEIAALVAGVFLLRGHDWARWLALAWMLFHVVFSAFNSLHEFGIHALICAVIAGALFRPTANQYFRKNQAPPTSASS